MKISISKATINDLLDILLLNKKLFAFERQFTDTYNPNWTYSSAGRDYFTKRLLNENTIPLIAKVDTKIVGYLIAFTQNYSYRSVNPITEVENMFVDEEYRSRGIGKALLNEVKTIAKKRGAKRIRVEAISQNSQAIQFYKKIGFAEFNTTLETVL